MKQITTAKLYYAIDMCLFPVDTRTIGIGELKWLKQSRLQDEGESNEWMNPQKI